MEQRNKLMREKLRKLILSETAEFSIQLKGAGLNELVYWEKRPENLPRELLVRYLKNIDICTRINPNKAIRKSCGGKFGESGFPWVFKFTDTMNLFGKKIEIYMKGYFFECRDPRGIEIQSFKKSTPFHVLKSGAINELQS